MNEANGTQRREVLQATKHPAHPGGDVLYELYERIGEGGSAQVWRARLLPADTEQTSPPKTDDDEETPPEWVALKTVPDVPRHYGRLREEARILTRLQQVAGSGPSRVVRIRSGEKPLDVKDHNHIEALIELEYLPHDTLKEWFERTWKARTEQVKAGTLTEEAALTANLRDMVTLGRELVAALRELEATKTLHRDLKPANVFFDGDRVRLIDFNIAKAADENPDTQIGTPNYTAPEAEGGPPTLQDSRLDYFGVGVILWEAAHGRPFKKSESIVRDPFRMLPRQAPFDERECHGSDEALILLDGLICERDRRIHTLDGIAAGIEALARFVEPKVVRPEVLPPGFGLIDLLLELRPNGEAAVVKYDSGVSQMERYVRDRLQVDDPLEDFLADRVQAAIDEDRPLLLMLSGNAGDGKSHLIRRLMYGRLNAARRSGRVEVNPDATHAMAPDANHQRDLEAFFAPFSADAPSSESAPIHVVAMNTGMAVQFFEKATETPAGAERFGALYDEVQWQLGLVRRERSANPPPVEVINLDLRSMTAPREDGTSFAEQMLMRLDPNREGSLTHEAAKACADCGAAERCPVRFNLTALTGEHAHARRVVIETLERAALDPNVHLSPRNLWGVWYRILTGGVDHYANRDGATNATDREHPTCETVRARTDLDPGWVLKTHFYQQLFHWAGEGPVWDALAALDPAYATVQRVDQELTRMGVSLERDVMPETIARLGGDGTILCGHDLRFLLPTNAPHARPIPLWERRNAAVRRAVFFDPEFATAVRKDGRYTEYADLLEAYDTFARVGPEALTKSQQETLLELVQLVTDAIVAACGMRHPRSGDDVLLRVDQPNQRAESRLLVAASRAQLTKLLDVMSVLQPDAHLSTLESRRQLADHLGYRPRAVTLTLHGMRLTLDPSLYAFLLRVRAGRRPSEQDRSQFQALELAGRLLGNSLAADPSTTEMYIENKTGVFALTKNAFGRWETRRVDQEAV